MYSVYSDYFLDHAKNLGTLSSSEVKKRIMRNLDTFQVIGILENHAVSMSLLRHLIDPVEGIDSSFWRNAAVMECESYKKELALMEGQRNLASD